MYHMLNPGRKIIMVAGIILRIFIRLMRVRASQLMTQSRRGPQFDRESPFFAAFHDIAETAGLTMKFVSGGEKTKQYIIEANGTGVALIDYDNDGWLDAFLVNSRTIDGSKRSSRLYRNKHDGTFADVTESAWSSCAGWGNGVCAGDINNDGYVDLFVTYWGANSLYRNSGKGEFRESPPAQV